MKGGERAAKPQNSGTRRNGSGSQIPAESTLAHGKIGSGLKMRQIIEVLGVFVQFPSAISNHGPWPLEPTTEASASVLIGLHVMKASESSCTNKLCKKVSEDTHWPTACRR